ncbi:hypothetical protein C9I49_06910 [Pseudomonas prosekii]|uniref:Uncharacterized protein n=1 Tax=Pseudomonas prosekii TaxID=1148509 RepID=A0A2U2DBC9_9PSED|nr:hypothetical protein C9I49_06910 [Pseudomonas prosekii]
MLRAEGGLVIAQCDAPMAVLCLNPGRAVIPPPRLRAKRGVISALLHLAEDGKDWALERASSDEKSLRIPATVGKKREAATVELGGTVLIDQ